MQIKPDRKFVTKQWLVLCTVSGVIALAGLLLVILVPLSPKVRADEAAAIIWPLTLAAILLLWLLAAPIVVLWIRNLSYAVDDDRITIHKGILTKVQQNIPYRAITDFELHRSLYDRALGIGTIKVQTAGQGATATGYEGQLAGLSDWAALHGDLRARLKLLHPHTDMATGVNNVPAATSDRQLLQAVLDELRAIRRALEQ